MPTKPGTTYTHATDLNFGSGPASGQPTKIVDAAAATQGFIPGQGVDAEAVNYIFNIAGEWLSDWVSQGTNAADLDAHIIETDANGTASIAALNAGNTAATFNAITAVENSGASATTILGTNSSGGVGVAAIATGGGVGLSADVFDTCDAVVGQVRGPGVAVTGRVFAGATGAALKGEGQVGGGPVLDLEFNATTPARGLAALQATDEPTAPAAGDVWRRPDEPTAAFDRRGGIEYQDDLGAPGKTGPGKLRAWATPEGVEFFQASTSGPIDSPSDSTGIVSAITLTIPKESPAGVYSIQWALEIVPYNSGVGGAGHAYVAFKQDAVVLRQMAVDMSNPAPAATYPGPATSIASQMLAGSYLFGRVVSPAVADTVFEIEFQACPSSPGALEGARINFITIEAVGVFDV